MNDFANVDALHSNVACEVYFPILTDEVIEIRRWLQPIRLYRWVDFQIFLTARS